MIQTDGNWHCYPMQNSEITQPAYMGEYKIVKAPHPACIICHTSECQQTTDGEGNIYHHLQMAN